jgi:hypothetical protein
MNVDWRQMWLREPWQVRPLARQAQPEQQPLKRWERLCLGLVMLGLAGAVAHYGYRFGGGSGTIALTMACAVYGLRQIWRGATA